MRTTKFKASEIGPIPADWEVKRLGEVCTITTGRKDVNEGCENGRYPFFTCSRNVFASNSYSFDCEAILVAGNGDVGNLHYFNGKFEAYQRTYVLYGFLENIEYIFHELTYDLMSCLNDGKIGSSIPYITIGQLNDFKFPLPPPNEQCRISAALSDADAWIESLDKLIEKKKLVKQGTMQALLSGKNRLPGFSGKWVEKRLGEIGTVFSGLSGKSASDFGRGEAKYVTFLNVLNNPILKPELFESVVVLPTEKQNCIRKGDLLFNTSSETPEDVGICAMLKDDVPNLYLNSFCFGFRLKKDDVESLYLAYYFRSMYGRRLMSLLAQGSTRYNLSKELFLSIEIPFPSLAEQRAITAVLSDMDAELAALSREKAKAEQIKQGMMQELLTGRVRLAEGE